MFPNYKGKLLTIMWMGVFSALLSSAFSAILIKLTLDINKRIKKQTQSQYESQLPYLMSLFKFIFHRTTQLSFAENKLNAQN